MRGTDHLVVAHRDRQPRRESDGMVEQRLRDLAIRQSTRRERCPVDPQALEDFVARKRETYEDLTARDV